SGSGSSPARCAEAERTRSVSSLSRNVWVWLATAVLLRCMGRPPRSDVADGSLEQLPDPSCSTPTIRFRPPFPCSGGIGHAELGRGPPEAGDPCSASVTAVASVGGGRP